MASHLITGNEFYCTQCGSRGIPVVRKKGAEREAGHLKKLFCLHCGCETNHVECREWDGYTHEDFLYEFFGGNFTEDGQRKEGYGLFKHNLTKENKGIIVKKILELDNLN